MKHLVIATTCLIALLGCSNTTQSELSDDTATYQGSVYQDVWNQIKSDEYRTLPQRRVSIFSFGAFFFNRLRSSANRTLSDRSDLLPRFNKLVHANGICLAGTWEITEENQFTGYFAEGSRALIIARASVALSNTKRGSYRAFGLAGKLFPTTDPNGNTRLKTANFFTMDDLGGTLTGDFTETTLLNAPEISVVGRGPVIASIGAAVASVFAAADLEPNVRQLYEVSELGMSDISDAITPRFMKLKGTSTSVPATRHQDFRNDLRIRNFPAGLSFAIEVSNQLETGWKSIGQITFSDDAASTSCDQRLHFHHPETFELNHGH